MLDNLEGVDLSGISGYIHYTYDNTAANFSSVIIAIGFLILTAILASALYTLLTGTRSQKYKNFLGDMWVAGKIKQLAIEDKINLEEEVEMYKLYSKKNSVDGKSIAYTVEEGMQERLQEKPKTEKKK